jgi:hypothetical protein
MLVTIIASWPLLTPGAPVVDVVNAAPADAQRNPEKDAANKNKNDNDGSNNNGNGNGNGNGNDNGNDVDDGDDEPHRDRNDRGGKPASPPAPSSVDGRCYAAGQTGALSLTLDGGTVTLNVVAASSFPRASRVTLSRVDPASVPATPGPRLDEIVFELRAQEGCDGNALGELPADANLGVSYRVPADKATLRLAVLDSGRWVDVPTIPDPTDPYVSATIRRTGVYVLYQAR